MTASSGGADWWAEPADLDLPRSYYSDPTRGQPGGVLGGDRIRLLCAAFGMIRPYDDRNLKPASYGLTLGTHAEVDGELREYEHGAPVVVGSGGWAKLVPAEAIVLPLYLVARIGLSVHLVHRGLLMGAGPQVDPGFQGYLCCPVHNLTGEAITLTVGERFGRIDFVSTTGQDAADVLADVETARRFDDPDRVDPADWRAPRFDPARRWRHPLPAPER